MACFLCGHVHLFYVHVGDVCACVSSNMRMYICDLFSCTYVCERTHPYSRACVRACLFGNYPPHLHPPSRPVQHSTVLAEEVYMMRLIMGNIMGKYRFMNIHENIYDYVARNKTYVSLYFTNKILQNLILMNINNGITQKNHPSSVVENTSIIILVTLLTPDLL